jgi:hypothetical protein
VGGVTSREQTTRQRLSLSVHEIKKRLRIFHLGHCKVHRQLVVPPHGRAGQRLDPSTYTNKRAGLRRAIRQSDWDSTPAGQKVPSELMPDGLLRKIALPRLRSRGGEREKTGTIHQRR